MLHVIPSVSPHRGGPSFTVRAMATALAQAGLNIHIATTDDDGPGRLRVPLGQPVSEKGVTYWYFPRQTRFYTASWPLTRWLSQHIRDYDLVHIHALFSYTALPAALFAVRQHVPYIVRPLGTLNRYGMQQHHPRLKRLSFHLIEQHILKRAAMIHYTSEQERIEAMELGINQRSVIIANPIDFTPGQHRSGQFRQRYPWLADRTVILFLSRIDPKKGLDLLLPAFAQVHRQHPHIALVVAGSGEAAYIAELQAQAEKLGIADNVLWTGFLEGAAKQAALNDADIFVLPSYSENFGNAVVEAMGCGLSVVISDQVGIHADIARHKAGMIVPCNVPTLARELFYLIANPVERQAMAERGQKMASTHFSVQSVTARLVEMYTELMPTQVQGVLV